MTFLIVLLNRSEEYLINEHTYWFWRLTSTATTLVILNIFNFCCLSYTLDTSDSACWLSLMLLRLYLTCLSEGWWAAIDKPILCFVYHNDSWYLYYSILTQALTTTKKKVVFGLTVLCEILMYLKKHCWTSLSQVSYLYSSSTFI